MRTRSRSPPRPRTWPRLAAIATSATELVAFSTSTLLVGAGTLTIHFTSPKTGFAVNDLVAVVLRSDPTIRMFGNVATFDGVDDMTVTVVSSGVFGSGSYSSWVIESAAFLVSGATSADIRAGTTDAVALTPSGVYAAGAEVTLTDASTIAVDMATFLNAKVTLGGNRTLGNPTNAKPSQSGVIAIKQDGTGSRLLSLGSNWKRDGGAPVFSTTANAEDFLFYYVRTTTQIIYTFLKAPS
jgi:hypothetical protein